MNHIGLLNHTTIHQSKQVSKQISNFLRKQLKQILKQLYYISEMFSLLLGHPVCMYNSVCKPARPLPYTTYTHLYSISTHTFMNMYMYLCM